MSAWKWDDEDPGDKHFDTFDGQLATPPNDKPAPRPRFTTFDERGFMDSKSIFASKTFWFNLLTGAGTILGTAQNVLPPSALPYVVLGSALVNVGLRLVTSQPVTVTGK